MAQCLITRKGGNSEKLLPKGYELKTGSMNYSECNSNANIIPIKLSCSIARYYTSKPYVKYGDTTVLSLNVWDDNHGGGCSATVSLYNISDLASATKQTITLYNPDNTSPSCKVIEWLEKVN